MSMVFDNDSSAVANSTYTYSVAQYIDAVQALEANTVEISKNKAVVDALEQYGDYAHDYLLPGETIKYAENYTTDTTDDNAIIAYYSDSINGRNVTGNYPSTDLKSAAMNLLLRSETVVTNQFSTASITNGYTFAYTYQFDVTVGDTTYQAGQEVPVDVVNTNGVLYVNSVGIPAMLLDKAVTLHITGNNTDYSIRYSPMVFAAKKLMDNTTGENTLVKNTVRSMYRYHKAAVALAS